MESVTPEENINQVDERKNQRKKTSFKEDALEMVLQITSGIVALVILNIPVMFAYWIGYDPIQASRGNFLHMAVALPAMVLMFINLLAAIFLGICIIVLVISVSYGIPIYVLFWLYRKAFEIIDAWFGSSCAKTNAITKE